MLGNIAQILEMKKKAEEMKKNLDAIVISETTKGVTIECNGNRKILAVRIEKDSLNVKDNLEDILVIAINNALQSAEKASMSEVGAMAGGLQGLMGLLGK